MTYVKWMHIIHQNVDHFKVNYLLENALLTKILGFIFTSKTGVKHTCLRCVNTSKTGVNTHETHVLGVITPVTGVYTSVTHVKTSVTQGFTHETLV